MTRRAWRDVKPGDRVELRGREYTVEKVKPDPASPKRVRVKVTDGKRSFKSEVRAKDDVKILAAPKAENPKRRPAVPAGDPKKKPGKLSKNPWESQLDRVERDVADILQARLVGEATDESAGYYVPPVTLATVASHIALFHGADPSTFQDELAMERFHDAEHASGDRLATHHWHTETRPAPVEK